MGTRSSLGGSEKGIEFVFVIRVATAIPALEYLIPHPNPIPNPKKYGQQEVLIEHSPRPRHHIR